MKRRTLVVGLGRSGQSACRFLLRRDKAVFGYDDRLNPSIADELQRQGVQLVSEVPNDLEQAIISPGFPPSHKIYQTLLERQIPVIGEVELGLREANRTIIGITGTSGKTTTTLLIAHVLNSTGHTAVAIGNVGLAVTGEIDSLLPHQIAVVELSSFQLETLSTRALDYAIILNLAPDHLDRYPSFAEYARAKWRIASCLKPGGRLFVQEGLRPHSCQTVDPITFSVERPAELYSDGRSIICNQMIEFRLSKRYEELLEREGENVMAAYSVCREFGLTAEEFFAAAIHFQRPAHRLEPIGEIDGVSFVNDSKGTNSLAVRRAIRLTNPPITLIAGGKRKESEFFSWLPWLSSKVQHVVALGESAELLSEQWGEVLPVTRCPSLAEAISAALRVTPRGGTVLLSPGCASFDMFKSYEERGECFKKEVAKILGVP